MRTYTHFLSRKRAEIHGVSGKMRLACRWPVMQGFVVIFAARQSKSTEHGQRACRDFLCMAMRANLTRNVTSSGSQSFEGTRTPEIHSIDSSKGYTSERPLSRAGHYDRTATKAVRPPSQLDRSDESTMGSTRPPRQAGHPDRWATANPNRGYKRRESSWRKPRSSVASFKR